MLLRDLLKLFMNNKINEKKNQRNLSNNPKERK